MPFQFLMPALLAGLAALAVPVLIHLRHRHRDRPQPFPSLMFLEQLAIKTERRQRLTDWPLLLVRAASLALLVLAFARPWWQGRAQLGSDARPRAVVLVIDRSQSMQYRGLFPRALDSARAVLGTLRRGDQVAVIAFDDRAELLQRLTDDHAAARAAVERLTPLARGTRLADALRLARHALRDVPFAVMEVVVISDLPQGAAEGLSTVALPSTTRIRPIAIRADARKDRSVRTLELQRLRRTAGPAQLLVKARIVARGASAPERTSASLIVNGRVATSTTVQLPANGEAVALFPAVAVPDAAVALQVAMPPDALPGNDTLYAVAAPDAPLRVLLTAPPGSGLETLHLKRAATVGEVPAFRIDEWTGIPPASDAARADILLLWDVAASPAQLRPWMAAGRGIILVPGTRLASTSGGRTLVEGVRIRGVIDHIAAQGTTFHTRRFEHPLFLPFREVPEAIESLHAWQTPRLDASSAFDQLASFDDGSPALLEQRRGRAPLLVVGLPLDARRGDAPLQPAFVPFVQQLLRHASGRDDVPLWRTTQELWALPDDLEQPVVESPTGELLRPELDSLGTRIATPDAGFYRGYRERASGRPDVLLAVNTPTAEASDVPLDPAELKVALAPPSSGAAARDSLAPFAEGSAAEQEARQGWWRILLAGVILLLVAETLMASRGRRALSRIGSPQRGSPRAG